MSKIVDIIGKKFNLVTVIEMYEIKDNRVYWKCVCECGKIFNTLGTSLKSGHTKSCGCLNLKVRSDAWKIHGCSHGKEMTKEERSTYNSWQSIKLRCYTPTHNQYHNYGGKGIQMCDRWRNSFVNFLADMGVKPTSAHSIDRYPDQNGNYEPHNCRWATRAEQNRNMRTNVWFEYNGIKLIQTDWAKVFNVTQGNLSIMVKKKKF